MKRDALHAIAHNKVLLIDATTLVTGSFNFTRAAQECRLHPRILYLLHPERAVMFWGLSGRTTVGRLRLFSFVLLVVAAIAHQPAWAVDLEQATLRIDGMA